jgi:hypothetical protein
MWWRQGTMINTLCQYRDLIFWIVELLNVKSLWFKGLDWIGQWLILIMVMPAYGQ